MSENDITRHIEAIIGAASSEEAERYARRRKKLSSSHEFAQRVTQLMYEELKVQPSSRRFYALARLGEYLSAAFRGDALPELLVTTGGSPEEIENEDLRPDSAEQWMKYIQKKKPTAVEPKFTGETGEYIRKTNLLRSIQDRLLAVSMKLKDGQAGANEFEAMQAVIRDCDRLLEAEPSRYFKPEDYELDRKKIEAVKYMARIEEKRKRFVAAKDFYEKAAKQYREIDEEYEAVSCLLDIAWLEFTGENKREAALDRVLEIHSQVSRGTLQAIEVNVVLGEIYGAFKDDHEAQQYLNEALKELDKREDLKNPSGVEFAQAFQSMLLSTGGDLPNKGDQNAFLKQNAARGLYRRIYGAFENIYRRQGDVAMAEAYQQKINELDGTMRDGNKFNFEFSTEMSKNLGDLLKKMKLT
ncbi:MAG: hypothetical protein WB586_14955 [Chthoniobacterales bacterium]